MKENHPFDDGQEQKRARWRKANRIHISERCTSQAKKERVCLRHGWSNSERCSSEGCTNEVEVQKSIRRGANVSCARRNFQNGTMEEQTVWDRKRPSNEVRREVRVEK